MNIHKYTLTGVAVLVLAIMMMLSGCSSSDGDYTTSTGDLREQSITLSDGRVVTCIVYQGYRKGGLSCDW